MQWMNGASRPEYIECGLHLHAFYETQNSTSYIIGYNRNYFATK